MAGIGAPVVTGTGVMTGTGVFVAAIGAGAMLGFFLEEIGPAVYNKAVADVQERLMGRVQELDYEVHEDEFPYWRRRRTPGKAL